MQSFDESHVLNEKMKLSQPTTLSPSRLPILSENSKSKVYYTPA